MKWDNEVWACRHIAKHDVSVDEAWEAVFEIKKGLPLVAPDQLHFPPYRRYWTISETRTGRKLLVVWEQHREKRNLITAFEPSPERIKIYETKIKKNRGR